MFEHDFLPGNERMAVIMHGAQLGARIDSELATRLYGWNPNCPTIPRKALILDLIWDKLTWAVGEYNSPYVGGSVVRGNRCA